MVLLALYKLACIQTRAGTVTLPLGNFVVADALLPCTPKPPHTRGLLAQMLITYAAVYSLTPQIKTTPFQALPHQHNDFLLRNAKLKLYGLKRGSILPGHFYDAVYFLLG